MITGIKGKILNMVLRNVVSSEVKRLRKSGIEPTTAIVLENADQNAISMLYGQGYTARDLVKITEEEIRK